MTTYTVNQFVAASSSAPITQFPETARNLKIVETFVDVALTSGFGTVNTGSGLTSGDVVKLLPLPIGAAVIYAAVETLTAFTTSTTIALGDSGSSTRFLAATAADAAVGYLGSASAAVHHYSAVDDVRITIGGANPVVGKVRVVIVLAELTKHLPASTAVL